MQSSSLLNKFFASTVNFLIVAVIFIPFWSFGLSFDFLRIVALGLFFLLSIVSLLTPDGRDPGMHIARIAWAKRTSLFRRVLYSLLYTGSFATLLYWIWIPGDLFVANMLLVQLPTVLLSRTTFHGWIAGMKTQRVGEA